LSWCLIAALWLAIGGTAQAELYKHTGPDGQITYSDRLPADVAAEPIDGRISVYAKTQTPASASNAGAVTQPRVRLYSTTWCGACKKAKAYMERKGIRYTEHDIEKNAKAKREFDAMNGRAVPLLVVGEQSMHGFDAKRFEAMLAAR
jgi:glutaredoxin